MLVFKSRDRRRQNKNYKNKVLKSLKNVTPEVALKASEGDRLKGNSGWASAIYFKLERHLLLRIPPSIYFGV